MKILILTTYYNRPKLLQKAMASILEANQYHSNWELVFGDDNSPIPGEPIVRKVLSTCNNQITCINSNMSFEDKIEQGLVIGKYANQVIQKSDADIAITLCDDDCLVPTYLRDISQFFETHPNYMWAYSHLAIYNPLYQKPTDINLNDIKECSYNEYSVPINPINKLDSSQVAFRLKVFEEGVKYPENSKASEDDLMPWLVNPDAFLFQEMYKRYGKIPFSNLISQYKGIHEHQLVWHKKQGRTGLKEYVDRVNDLGGELL